MLSGISVTIPLNAHTLMEAPGVSAESAALATEGEPNTAGGGEGGRGGGGGQIQPYSMHLVSFSSCSCLSLADMNKGTRWMFLY